MSFTIRLSQDLTAVEAGATVPLSIEITNKGDEEDRFEMQVEGLDPEWTASPEPVFTVGSKEIHNQKVFFKPPRTSESSAGNYPFVVKVRSLNSGDSRTAQGVLQIKAFNHLSMELNPRKGHSTPVRHQFTFSLTVMNLGNTEHTLQLTGADPEEECAYEFANDQITVGPGQQRDVEVMVAASSAGYFASTKLFGFVISARSIQNPNIVATAQGQLERRPLLSPATLLTVVLLLAALFLWIAVKPKPPTISVSVSDSNVVRGQTVHVSWKAANASSVRLEVARNKNNQDIKSEPETNLPLEGVKDILTGDEDAITVRAIAVADNQQKEVGPITISVREPIKPTNPTIADFKANSKRIKLGESVIFSFDYSSDVNKLVLSPRTTEQILPPARQIQITPTEVGKVEYQLLAYNAQGGFADSKKITVEVYQASEASIQFFTATPPIIQAPDTKTVVTWNVTNAETVQLDDGTGSGLKPVEATNTTGMDVVTDKTVTLKLIATDAKGVATTKTLPIKYKPLPPSAPLGPGGTPPPTAGGGAAGKTTGGP
ncbi:MAG: hypothetical protein ACHQ50_08875 [Fimbriimonadales bacterium]